MASRIIMRIELSSEAKRRFENMPDVLGMTQLAVTSRLVEWFLDQNEELQASILGLYPAGIGADITTTLLKRFISDAKRPMHPRR
jgi:hypothetical protein